MDPPRLALPADLARSLRHLDDAQLEELLRTATAEARRRGLIAKETGRDPVRPGNAVPKNASDRAAAERASPISPGLERIVRAALEAGVKPAAITRQFCLQRAEVQRIARSERKR
ncbi:MAG: hypothetical protein OYH76_01855 [Defluviicoccus sp.]|nr:hypothetical protein [Defluviicoccus sp.]MDE0274608.1 hypothetical protein [Defluviicoccus sp.]